MITKILTLIVMLSTILFSQGNNSSISYKDNFNIIENNIPHDKKGDQLYGDDIQFSLDVGAAVSSEYYNEINKYYGTNDKLNVNWYNFDISCEFRLIQNLFIYPKIGLSTSSITKDKDGVDGTTSEIVTDPNTIYRFGAGGKYYLILTDVSSITFNLGLGFFSKSSGNRNFQFKSNGVILDFAAGYLYHFDIMNGIGGGAEIGYRSIPVISIYDSSKKNYGGIIINLFVKVPISSY
jgi:hypothetical protein